MARTAYILLALIILTAWDSGVTVKAFPNFPDLPEKEAFYKPTAGSPNVALEVHKINRMRLAVTNNGNFGIGYFWGNAIDPETGLRTMSCEYPINSRVEYLWTGSLWLGAVVGRDTLVSTGAEIYYWLAELWPDDGEKGQVSFDSTQIPVAGPPREVINEKMEIADRYK